jgi:serine/threonine protein kinase
MQQILSTHSKSVIIKIVDLNSQEDIALTELRPVPHISKIYTVFTVNNKKCIVIYYTEGNELDEYLEHHHHDYQIEMTILDQLIKIIIQVHQRQWIHGDIHTRNIIVDSALNVTLIDFGTATKIGTFSKMVPLYPPPESLILSGDQYIIDPNYNIDIKYDYWALGLVCIRLFTDESIPTASIFMLDEYPADYIYKLYTQFVHISELPTQINNIISNLLNHDPHQRHI